MYPAHPAGYPSCITAAHERRFSGEVPASDGRKLPAYLYGNHPSPVEAAEGVDGAQDPATCDGINVRAVACYDRI